MEAFRVISGIAAPMLAANIDTDVIMPKQFLMGIDRSGLDQGVFFDQRFLTSGTPNPEFVLNRPAWQGAKFLVVGPNFGCGSSREHAVWGLKQLGIRALIGTSFAGIFYDNCQRNGLLLIELDNEQIQIIEAFSQKGSGEEISIDLPNQKILLPEQVSLSFNIDPIRKNALLEGLDAIGSTLKMVSSINTFEEGYLRDNPWLG
ncbi:3-isopropylmalate dehydratase small subunit [Kordiimonas pumila]|uniref:3-isopropylmalate dehydratase small subunit n=1 Tax=Kordiimonas pumila TaxID=2161677 RepID=A0ABV7D4F3_9PROT|nr:3-isopropylmalate dehydratase small subunit [Kordiimonas pumila]